jgi:hypothetical protein
MRTFGNDDKNKRHINNPVELSPSLQAVSGSAIQEFTNIL